MTDHNVLTLTWNDVRARVLGKFPEPYRGKKVWGVPRGGWPIAQIAAEFFGCELVDNPNEADLIVDDLVDSGATRDYWIASDCAPAFWAAYNKQGESDLRGRWLVFPWEVGNEDMPKDEEEIARRFLQTVGMDTATDGTRDTPRRMLKALRELTDGYRGDPAAILAKRFTATYDEMVCVRDIEFYSLCEHHVLPFHGTATVAYIPKDHVVGLSKLGRLVKMHARRFQIQERMTDDIAKDMLRHIPCEDAAVVIRSGHLCMAMRGIEAPAEMVTSSLHGRFRDPEVRAEFLALAKGEKP